MLSKKQIKLISSLQKKKFRDRLGLFVAEGEKLVEELLEAKIQAEFLVCTNDWGHLETARGLACIKNIVETETRHLKKISNLKTPPPVIGVFGIPAHEVDEAVVKRSLSLLLDDVQDPGNLGTIVRIADWFGIEHVFCSPNTADIYNPKAIQSTMGAVSRVKVVYAPLPELIEKYRSSGFPVYGTFLDGEIIYEAQLGNRGFIVMGNEGKGISERIGKMVSERLLVPSFPADRDTSESLNVSAAASVVCSEFRRRGFINPSGDS